jgi:DNA-binding SARP family transcriptional activator
MTPRSRDEEVTLEAGFLPPVRVRLLGTFSLVVGGTPVRLESAKTEALLAFLVLEPGRHSRTKLAGLLWPEIAGERAARNLRHALWGVRRAFAAAAPDAIASSRTHAAFVPGDRVQVECCYDHDSQEEARPPMTRARY